MGPRIHPGDVPVSRSTAVARISLGSGRIKAGGLESFLWTLKSLREMRYGPIQSIPDHRRTEETDPLYAAGAALDHRRGPAGLGGPRLSAGPTARRYQTARTREDVSAACGILSLTARPSGAIRPSLARLSPAHPVEPGEKLIHFLIQSRRDSSSTQMAFCAASQGFNPPKNKNFFETAWLSERSRLKPANYW